MMILPTDVWLSPEEVIALTECKRRLTQCKRLAEMRIPFRPNWSGRPLVERAAVLAYNGVAAERKSAEPNWSALD